MTELAKNTCEACNGQTPKATPDEIAQYLKEISGWEVVDGRHIFKKWKFKDFAEALKQVNAIGALAESEGHHPDIHFGWGFLEVTLTTHVIKGLSKNDFILAAKIDGLQ